MSLHAIPAPPRETQRLTESPLAGLRLEADLRPHSLRLARPWRTAGGVIREPRGWHLLLDTPSGLRGIGEAACLRRQDWEVCGSALTGLVEAGAGRSFGWWLAQRDRLPPAARMAVESALLMLAAGESGLPLYRWLAGEARPRVRVNTVAGVLDGQAQRRLWLLAEAGYSLAKFKVGVFAVTEELERLRGLEVPQGMRLRLDANRAWTPREAEAVVGALAGLPIEGLEEPLSEPHPEGLARLQETASFPLALDESLLDRYRGVPAAELPVRRLVLKPTLLGGLLPAWAVAWQARAAGREVVFTSTLEGPVGLRAVAHLAAAWGAGVHGLGVAAWWEKPEPELLPRGGMLEL